MNTKELDNFKMSDAVAFHDHLNPKLWIGTHLEPKVQSQLLMIANDFLEDLGVSDLKVIDITISGSNAAFSYTPHSDLDLHVVVDMTDFPNDEVYTELFTAKKTLYNDAHTIKVHGIPVELYVQNAAEPAVSIGQYSVLHKKWIKLPSKRRAHFDQTATKAKYNKLAHLIAMVLKGGEITRVDQLLKTIKQYRQAGLAKGGEFGPENLAYKVLRSRGVLTALYDLRDRLHSKELSIENMYTPHDPSNDTIQIPIGRNGRATATAPRFLYHILLNAAGGISGYQLRPREASIEHEFDAPSQSGYVWLAADRSTRDSIKIDASKLNPSDLRFTGQADSAIIHRGNIPVTAIVARPGDTNESKLLDNPTLTVDELASKHKISRQDILKQLDIGIKSEKEHTSNYDTAKEIALDHLSEDPHYYSKLKAADL